MKTRLKLVSVILLIALTFGTVILFGACTDNEKPIYVEILIINPLTGEERDERTGHEIIYLESEVPEETLIQAKFKNKETGEYLTDEEIEPVKSSIRFGVMGSKPGQPPWTVGRKYWPTKAGKYSVIATFDSMDGNRDYYDKFIPTSATWTVTIKEGEKI